ncbi:tyrosine-type recombinase/integrase, partial [Enterococcus faecalis]
GHTLRHTYASMQLRNGLDIYTLSLNMGHSSIEMTQRYVQTLSSEDFIEKSIKTSTLMNLK